MNNVKRQGLPIPELPKNAKKLQELLKKDFKILWESTPVSESGGEYHPGGVAVTEVLMKCPFCGKQFAATRRSGCFMNNLSPRICPSCKFPNNVDRALSKIQRKKKRS